MSQPAPAQATAQTGKRALSSVESKGDALTPESPRKRPCKDPAAATAHGDEGRKKENEGNHLASSSSSSDPRGRLVLLEGGDPSAGGRDGLSTGLAAPVTMAGRDWFSRHLARTFLCKQRHHSNVGFNLTPMKKKNGLYIEYREDSAGSRRHPCPAYDGLTHDASNAYIEPSPEFMHVSVLCKEGACKRLGPVLFKVQDHEEKLRRSRNPSTGRGSNRKTNQQVDEVEEPGQGGEDDEGSDDEETRAAKAAKAEKRDKKYLARLERLLAKLAPLPRPAELDYIGQDLPSGTLEKACKKREHVLREAVKLFMKYWAREAAAERKFDSLQARGSGEKLKEEGSFEEDSGEDSDSASDDDHWKDIFRERYEHARKELVQRLTLFMNDYLCHIKGPSKEAIAVFWGQGQEKTWVLKPIDDFKYQGDDLEIELPSSSIKLKSKKNKGKREPSGIVELDRGVMTTLRKAWLQSSRRRIAKSIDFFTNPREEALHNTRYSDRETDTLNWFTGFRVSTQQVRNYMETNALDDSAMHELAAPFREYVHDILAGGVTQMSRYLFKWMYTLLREGKKPEQACVFMSGSETGGSAFVELLTRVIGEQWVFELFKPGELTGKYNFHLGFRVLVVNNTNMVGSSAMQEKITAKKLNLNPKFMSIFTVRDPSGLFFNCNHSGTILVEKGERYKFFPVSNNFVNHTTSAQEYIARLRALPDEVLAWQLFLSQDLQASSHLSAQISQEQQPQYARDQKTSLEKIAPLPQPGLDSQVQAPGPLDVKARPPAVCDSPQEHLHMEARGLIVPFGKYKNKSLSEMLQDAIYVEWVCGQGLMPEFNKFFITWLGPAAHGGDAHFPPRIFTAYESEIHKAAKHSICNWLRETNTDGWVRWGPIDIYNGMEKRPHKGIFCEYPITRFGIGLERTWRQCAEMHAEVANDLSQLQDSHPRCAVLDVVVVAEERPVAGIEIVYTNPVSKEKAQRLGLLCAEHNPGFCLYEVDARWVLKHKTLPDSSCLRLLDLFVK